MLTSRLSLRFHFRCIGLDEERAALIEAYCCDICTEMGLGTTRSKFNLAVGCSCSRWRAVGVYLHLQEPPSTDLLPFLRSMALAQRASPALGGHAPSPSGLFSALASVDVLAGHQAGVVRNLPRLARLGGLLGRCLLVPLPSPPHPSALPPYEERNAFNSSATLTVVEVSGQTER